MTSAANLYVAVIARDGRVEYATNACLTQALQRAHGVRMDVHYAIFPYRTNVCTARARAVERARERKANLLMIDGNVVFSEGAILDLVSRGCDVVGGMTVSEDPPHHICAAVDDGEGHDVVFDVDRPSALKGLHEVTSVEFAMVAINKKVLGQMSGSLFAFGETDGVVVDEATMFCRRARKLGFKVWLDWDLSVGRIGQYIYSSTDYARHKAARAADRQEGSIIVPAAGLVVPN